VDRLARFRSRLSLCYARRRERDAEPKEEGNGPRGTPHG